MIELLPQSSETCLGFKISGKVTVEDYDVLLPKLDEAIAEQGKINLLVVIEDFEGYGSVDAAKADYKFGTHQYRQVEKAAFVGDKKRQERLLKILNPITRHTDERYFDQEQIDDAWRWVKQQESGTGKD